MFLGNLNTMGQNMTYINKGISGNKELSRLKKRAAAARVKMTVFEKSVPSGVNEQVTIWPGSRSSLNPSNFDYVMATDHLRFKQFGGSPVDLRGWPQETTAAKRDAWATAFSDHALLYFRVQKA